MASIVNSSASLRIRNYENSSVCSISGVNPSMTAEAAAGFVLGIQNMYNSGPVKARIHTVSELEIAD